MGFTVSFEANTLDLTPRYLGLWVKCIHVSNGGYKTVWSEKIFNKEKGE